MKIDDDILSRFRHPYIGMMYIYLSLKGGGEITYKTVADDMLCDESRVKQVLNDLETKKEIKVHPTSNGFTYEICKKCITSLKVKERVERDKKFYSSLIPYLDEYPKEMIREFYDYWSEPNKSMTKMRFENEKTWDLARRLARWSKMDKKYGNNKDAALDAGATALERVLTNL